ncbi:phage DNA packaging protein J [Arthrobacter sp. NPDC097144]
MYPPYSDRTTARPSRSHPLRSTKGTK